MRVRFRLLLVVSLAWVLSACSETPDPAAPPPAPAVTAATSLPETARLDTEALRQRAAEALAVNRLFAPAGNNAVEDYLALRERLPDDLAVGTALLDLAPYVVIGAEQAKAAGQFDEAERLVDLLLRMDAEAPAAPRLHEGLLSARQSAAAETEVERLAAAASIEREAAARAAATARPAAAVPARPTAEVPAPPVPTPEPRPVAPPVAAVLPPPVPAPPPRALLAQSAPRFPDQALRRRLEGNVQLQLQVAADGSVLAAEVLSSTHAVFEREAVLAARRWRFAPAPAASTERVAVAFRQPEA